MTRTTRRLRGRGRVLAAAAAVAVLPSVAGASPAAATTVPDVADGTVRVAAYSVGLARAEPQTLARDLSGGQNEQARALAEVLQRTRPDVVLLSDVDRTGGGAVVDLLREDYLAQGQAGADPVEYPYAFSATVNSGVPSGHDLDGDGEVGGAGDSYGPGAFPGQQGMIVLSRHPIASDDVRTFRRFRWQDMPGALLPDDPGTPEPGDWYAGDELADVRLSSTSHWDVPVEVGDGTVHVLAAGPTAAASGGTTDRDARRNHDEIRFWADYVSGGDAAAYVYDDRGVSGGLDPDAEFVVLGDLGGDPVDGEAPDGADPAPGLLLDGRLVTDPMPASPGGEAAAAQQGGANADHDGDPRLDTADLTDDPAPGNLRRDYVLPSPGLEVTGAGIFWPVPSDPLSRLTGSYPFPTSEHRLVWVDVRVPGA